VTKRLPTARTVACPKCKAKAGRPCKFPGGGVGGYVHQSRRRAAEPDSAQGELPLAQAAEPTNEYKVLDKPKAVLVTIEVVLPDSLNELVSLKSELEKLRRAAIVSIKQLDMTPVDAAVVLNRRRVG
jgi:hypothetical protein